MRARSLAALLLLGGCTVGGSVAERRSDATAAAPAVEPTGSASVGAVAEAAPDDWRAAARRLDWHRAYALLSALPEDERRKPDVRLALGRAALECGEAATAVGALAGLGAELPVVREEIDGWYARAAAAAGPYEEAARLFEASPKVRDLVQAARAWQRAGDGKKARAMVDRAIQRAERTKRVGDAGHAHALRAEIAEQAGDKATAAADWRWIVMQETEEARVREAIAGVDRVGAHLGTGERLDALVRSTNSENVDDTLTQIDTIAREHPTERGNAVFARARALGQARDWARALGAFDEAIGALPAFAPEARYQAARCAARQGQLDDALERWRGVARAGGGPWAERASYRVAELLLTMGRFAEAADAFGGYLSRFGRGESADDAHYGQALAVLLAGNAKRARGLLANLRRRAEQPALEATLAELEGVAAQRDGDVEAARKIWLQVMADQPLTWASLAAQARLRAIGQDPLPPLLTEPPPRPFAPLPVVLPPAAALLHDAGLDDAAERRLGEMEQEAASPYLGRESEALCEMYGQLVGGRRRHQVGSRAVSLEMLMRPPTTAERWAWRCVYPDPWSDLVRREEASAGLPAGFVHAVMRQESAFHVQAVSPVGARGLMQLMPSTARRAAAELAFALDGDPDMVNRPDVNLHLGAFYLKKLLGSFAGNVVLATAAYNAGPHAVEQWLRAGAELDADLWVARIPYRETRTYVQRVMGNLARYQWLNGGIAQVTPLELALPQQSAIGDDAY
jgi:peptidoglycan lytic transglycosylase